MGTPFLGNDYPQVGAGLASSSWDLPLAPQRTSIFGGTAQPVNYLPSRLSTSRFGEVSTPAPQTSLLGGYSQPSGTSYLTPGLTTPYSAGTTSVLSGSLFSGLRSTSSLLQSPSPFPGSTNITGSQSASSLSLTGVVSERASSPASLQPNAGMANVGSQGVQGATMFRMFHLPHSHQS
eukprot:386786-Pyramimonas_sp.AAC.1